MVESGCVTKASLNHSVARLVETRDNLEKIMIDLEAKRDRLIRLQLDGIAGDLSGLVSLPTVKQVTSMANLMVQQTITGVEAIQSNVIILLEILEMAPDH